MLNIYKLNHEGRQVYEYTGELLERDTAYIKVRAAFNLPDKQKDYVTFREGDQFIEWHYTDHWYNIAEVHDVDDDHLKGWYCNIIRPATFGENQITWADLALDVWIAPDGSILILDEDEMDALEMDETVIKNAWAAIDQIKACVQRRDPPFDVIPR
jgi:uncharacterized protein